MRQNVRITSVSLFLGLFAFFFLIQTGVSKAATFNVPGDFATIQEAIDDAGTVNGDIINVLAGTHIEAFIHITKELTIQGQGIGVTILDPSSLGGTQVVLYPDANNVTIQDMTIQNASQAIRFEINGGTIDNTDILRVSMLNNTSRGIEVHNNTTVTNLLVDLSNFENTNHGLRLSSSGHLDGVTFQNSTFTNNVIGIYVANDGGTSTMANMLVTDCTFSNHTTGQGTAIFLEEAQDTRIQDSMFSNNRRDVQLFKWYQPSVQMSNLDIVDNTMIGTTNAVFAIFNADNGGQTVFNDIRFLGNNAMTNDASAVFAGAHSSGPPSAGGAGWNTVRVRNNCFTGITTAGNGVRFFLPAGITPDQALGGAVLNAVNNWWGTTDLATITALMEVPAITDFQPFRNNDICAAAFFVLQPLQQSFPGQANTLNITGGIPNGDVKFVYGFTEGISDTSSICEDSELDIEEFFELATVTGDASGNASLDVFVPDELVDQTVLVQALDMTTCVESVLNAETFTEAGTGIMHLPIVPGQAGVLNTLSADQATPSGGVMFIWGFTQQTVTANNICPGLQAGILNPRILNAITADEFGDALLNVNVPSSLAGVSVVVQAVDLVTCTASNVVSETF